MDMPMMQTILASPIAVAGSVVSVIKRRSVLIDTQKY
jgi:hypothetical protein